MNPVEEDRALDGESDLASGDERRGRAAMDPTTRHLVFIACGIGLLLLVVIGGWTLSGRRPSEIPVIEAQSGPVRLKPIDPGGMQAMGAQAPSSVNASGIETLAPLPESARPEALQAEVDAARRREDRTPAAPAAHAPVVRPPPVRAVAPPPAAASAPVVSEPPDQGQTTGTPATGHHAEAVPKVVTSLPGSGQPAVQLAALDSHEAAELEWSRLSRSHPLLFSGHTPDVEPADHAGRRIYRLRTGGFASAAEAHAFCEQARSLRIACTFADF